MTDWKNALTSDLIAEVARIACGPNPELLAVSKAAKELDRRWPTVKLPLEGKVPGWEPGKTKIEDFLKERDEEDA